MRVIKLLSIFTSISCVALLVIIFILQGIHLKKINSDLDMVLEKMGGESAI